MISQSNMTVTDKIQELCRNLQSISKELHQQVVEKHGALLQQASHTGRFDVELNSLSDDVQRISATSQRLKKQVDLQCSVLETQTSLLSHLHELSHLLRLSGTMLNLTSKLKSSKDVLKQTDIHNELGHLLHDTDLKNIEFIQQERIDAIGNRQKINNLTQMKLISGLQERKLEQVVTSLKIFLNLNHLSNSLENLITTYISELDQYLKQCFAGTDISGISKDSKALFGANKNLAAPGRTPVLTTNHNFRSKFWKNLHWIIYDEVFECCNKIQFLKSALEQVNHFGSISKKDKNVQTLFWEAVHILFRKSFAECPTHIIQIIQEDLPKLLSSVRGLETRLNNEFIFQNDLFADLEEGYISKCSANMKVYLAVDELPSTETVDNFISVAAKEFIAALIDPKLIAEVTAVFVAGGRELYTKWEPTLHVGDESEQVVDIPNAKQTHNAAIANFLFYYKESVKQMLQTFREQLIITSSQSLEQIENSIQHVDMLINTILQQIMNSIISNIKIILLSIHREPGLSTETISPSVPSMYLKELQDFILRSWTNHVALFDDKEIVKTFGVEMSKQCIELFIYNISIIRPLSCAGRIRLKNDCLYMEQVLKPMCPNISNLGKSMRLLRAMSLLIVKSPNELVQQNISHESLVPSYIILFLLFGHAGPELQSPHTAANWSNERIIEWLEGHTSDRERLELISGALQRYRDIARRKNSQQYDEIYPLLIEFFERSFEENTKSD